jgi:hypothetical protein
MPDPPLPPDPRLESRIQHGRHLHSDPQMLAAGGCNAAGKAPLARLPVIRYQCISCEHLKHLASQINELILEVARGNCTPRVDRFRRENQILAATEETRWKHCRNSASRAPT